MAPKKKLTQKQRAKIQEELLNAELKSLQMECLLEQVRLFRNLNVLFEKGALDVVKSMEGKPSSNTQGTQKPRESADLASVFGFSDGIPA